MKFKKMLKKALYQGKATPTGKVKALSAPLSMEFKTHTTDVMWSTINEYRFEARFGRAVFCKDYERPRITDMVYKEVMDYVYGDLRRRLSRLHYLISSDDRDTLREELDNILKEIHP